MVSDMPDKTWLRPYYKDVENGEYKRYQPPEPFDTTKYIRGDIHEALQKQNAELLEALEALMGGDEKMQVAIGGNPIYVDAFIEKARKAIDDAKGGSDD
jgi:hypothetical protein